MTFEEWWAGILQGFVTADYPRLARTLGVSGFLGLIIGSLFLLRDDQAIRRKGRWALVILLVPFLGPLFYLWRPEPDETTGDGSQGDH